MSADLLWIALSLITWGMGEGMFFYFTPLYLQQMGANPLQIGGILGAIGLAMTMAHLPAGYLADRVGRRPLMITAWSVGTLAAWIMALAPNLPVFVIGSALYGFTAFVSAPMNSYIASARGKWSVGRAFTLMSAIYNVGAILGPLLGGWSAYRFGLRTNFLTAACVFVVSTFSILCIRPQPVEIAGAQSGASQLKSLLNRRFVIFLAVTFFAMLCMYLPQPLSQNFLQNERGVGLARMGQLLALRSAGVVLLNLTLGHLSARLGFLAAQASLAGFALLLWKGSGISWYAMGYLLAGGYMTARLLANAQGRALLPSASMGLGFGLMETVMALVTILAPPLAGALYGIQPSLVYGLSFGLILISLPVSALALPKDSPVHLPHPE